MSSNGKNVVFGCTRVFNGEKYVDRWVRQMLAVCDYVSVVDDGSTDGTPDKLLAWSKKHPNVMVHLYRGAARRNGLHLQTLHDQAAAVGATWVFSPDIDEFIHENDYPMFRRMTSLPDGMHDIQGWTFPFFYLWNDEQHYRMDGQYAECHVIRLYRFNRDVRPARREAHAQMCPEEINRNLIRRAPIRMVHLGYMDPADRQAKFEFYTQRDADPMKAGSGGKDYRHVLGEDAVVAEYPTHDQWRTSGDGRTIHRCPSRRQIGGVALVPGFDHHFDIAAPQELYVRGLEYQTEQHGGPVDVEKFMRRCLESMDSGGRIDVITVDFPTWCQLYSTWDAPRRAQEFDKMHAWKQPMVGKDVASTMDRVGFTRVELLPALGYNVHILAYKQSRAHGG